MAFTADVSQGSCISGPRRKEERSEGRAIKERRRDRQRQKQRDSEGQRDSDRLSFGFASS